ncbi:hypothetical protein WG66_006837 [Moniliophthora roreri]|nr:hypothetical protein WG66_006837 [Moniliophthora roreri]
MIDKLPLELVQEVAFQGRVSGLDSNKVAENRLAVSPERAHPPIRYTIWIDNETCRLFPPEPTDTEEVKEALDQLPDILPRALCALKGLASVHWTMNHIGQGTLS